MASLSARRGPWRPRLVEPQRLLAVKGIADTGFLVAFANRHDVHHEWAVDVAEQLDRPLLTCEAVLAACAFHLQDAIVTLDMIREGLVAVSLDVTKE